MPGMLLFTDFSISSVSVVDFFFSVCVLSVFWGVYSSAFFLCVFFHIFLQLSILSFKPQIQVILLWYQISYLNLYVLPLIARTSSQNCCIFCMSVFVSVLCFASIYATLYVHSLINLIVVSYLTCFTNQSYKYKYLSIEKKWNIINEVVGVVKIAFAPHLWNTSKFSVNFKKQFWKKIKTLKHYQKKFNMCC